MGYRATQPLDPAALAAANAAVAPETGGRPLTMGSKDRELRNKWMRAYMDALGGEQAALDSGKVVKTGAKGKKPKGCNGKCPKEKKVTARITKVTFRSDHMDGGKKLLKKHKVVKIKSSWQEEKSDGTLETKSLDLDSKMSDEFDEFQKPEWDIARGGSADSHPISHTMDQKVKVDVEVEFEVTPDGETAQMSKIIGNSTFGVLEFEHDHSETVSTGPVTITGLETKDKLVTEVMLLEEDVEWSVVVDGEEKKIGKTGKHKLYVTLDKPFGKLESPANNSFVETGSDQVVTDARLEYSVKACDLEGVDTEKKCVDQIFEEMRKRRIGYFLGHRWERDPEDNTHIEVGPGGDKPTLHHYLWLCNVKQALGECHNIAASFGLACRIVGVKKSFAVGFMYPWPGRGNDHPDYPKTASLPAAKQPEFKSGSGRFVLGRLNRSHTRDHSAQSGHGTSERLYFLDGAGKGNNFEGVLVFDGKGLYAIGDDIFDRTADVDDNASEYYCKRKLRPSSAAGQFRNPDTEIDLTKGGFKLRFFNTATDIDCGTPYGTKVTTSAFQWHD